jgi:hypothetical protein
MCIIFKIYLVCHMNGDRICSQTVNRVKKFNTLKGDILDCIYISELTHLMMERCNLF